MGTARNLLVSFTEASDNNRRYSCLSITTTPDPLSGSVITMSLQLCQNFDLTPTFAKVDKDKRSKWKSSSENFSRNVIKEELKEKSKQRSAWKREINSIYDEIRQNCSSLRYTCILRTMTSLQARYHQEVITTHTHKISRLINNQLDLDEHILY